MSLKNLQKKDLMKIISNFSKKNLVNIIYQKYNMNGGVINDLTQLSISTVLELVSKIGNQIHIIVSFYKNTNNENCMILYNYTDKKYVNEPVIIDENDILFKKYIIKHIEVNMSNIDIDIYNKNNISAFYNNRVNSRKLYNSYEKLFEIKNNENNEYNNNFEERVKKSSLSKYIPSHNFGEKRGKQKKKTVTFNNDKKNNTLSNL